MCFVGWSLSCGELACHFFDAPSSDQYFGWSFSMCLWSHVRSINLLKQYVHSRLETHICDIILV